MKKLLIISISLLCLNISAYYYLKYLLNNIKPFEYKFSNNVYLYQIKDIEIENINDFVFSDYFKLNSFNKNSYKYKFDEEYIYITLDNSKTCQFVYTIKKPQIIEKVIYKEVENNNNGIDYEDNYENYMYIDNNVLEFSLNTSLDDIRQILKNNIHTTYETTIDYSRLNTSSIGDYIVTYNSDFENIDILIKIV